ncbi:MAG: hypothetical protein UY95_C0004G0005 [Parcubacteria group bacterium GW2011_GWA2_56_7]|nr:MAG: hypothetical protein UY95_C0004G0005 [Parcubacteria group bacterium GW2011_GWA2_56_7]
MDGEGMCSTCNAPMDDGHVHDGEKSSDASGGEESES